MISCLHTLDWWKAHTVCLLCGALYSPVTAQRISQQLWIMDYSRNNLGYKQEEPRAPISTS